MKKRSITRYDQELVLETIVDYDNEEISAWILEPVKQEIGGGGSALGNPILSLTVNNNTTGTMGINVTYLNNDNILVAGQAVEEIEPSGQLIIDTILVATEYLGDPTLYYNYGYWDYAFSGTVSVTNLVNCTDDSGAKMITITDPTLPASCTITVTE